MAIRIGQGVDAHRFRDGGRLVLGGVEVPHDQGLAAHSDGDCVLHAILDALLGAMGARDIGWHFPDSDPALAGCDSRELLRQVVSWAGDDGWAVINTDATIVAQRPRLGDYLPEMRRCVAADLAVAEGAVNIKATTTEQMGFTGRGEGIAAMAVVLIGGP